MPERAQGGARRRARRAAKRRRRCACMECEPDLNKRPRAGPTALAVTLPQLVKYDIQQKVVAMLADAEARAIMFSAIKRGRTASDLARILRIPISSVYKKLSDLEDLALVRVERVVLTDSGRKMKVYRSRVSEATITIRKPEPMLTLLPN